MTQTPHDDAQFFAWLDGELDPSEAREMAARVAADPQLTALAEQHRALQSRLRGAFDPIAAAPPPSLLTAALAAPAEVIDLAQRRAARPRPPAGQWMAIAASLAAGIFVGRLMLPAGGPVELRGGNMVAASALAGALDSQLASAPSGDIRIGLTYRDQEGRICRTFAGAAGSGLACRDDAQWRVEGLFPAAEGQESDFRMASGADPQLAALVDSTIAGEPFGAAEEKRAKARGWK